MTTSAPRPGVHPAGATPDQPTDQPTDSQCRSARLLDLGAGRGLSLELAMRRFGVEEALGFDINPAQVRRAQAKGLPIYERDVRELDPADFPAVEYVNIDNVLEHLPDLASVERILGIAVTLAGVLVHIRHPAFDEDPYLESLGLKTYWSDWPGEHTAKVRVSEFVEMANRLGVYRTLVIPVRRLVDSSDDAILPIGAPPHQSKRTSGGPGVYDLAAHGPKSPVTFDRPVYFAYDILLLTGQELPTILYPRDPERFGTAPLIRSPDPAARDMRPAGTRAEVHTGFRGVSPSATSTGKRLRRRWAAR